MALEWVSATGSSSQSTLIVLQEFYSLCHLFITKTRVVFQRSFGVWGHFDDTGFFFQTISDVCSEGAIVLPSERGLSGRRRGFSTDLSFSDEVFFLGTGASREFQIVQQVCSVKKSEKMGQFLLKKRSGSFFR